MKQDALLEEKGVPVRIAPCPERIWAQGGVPSSSPARLPGQGKSGHWEERLLIV